MVAKVEQRRGSNGKEQYAELMIPTQCPTLPWQRVGTDLFEYKRIQYLLVRYFSHYIEISKLSTAQN